MTDQNLEDFARRNSKFLKLDDKESFTGKYVSSKCVPSAFDPDKEIVQYELEYLDGQKVTWNNGSGRVAKEFAKIKLGETVTITRDGLATKTRYEIKQNA